MMEADTVQAQLVGLFKSAVIFTPYDYTFFMRHERPEHPRKVKLVGYKFITNFDELPSNVSSIQPGHATINEITRLK